MATPTYDAFVRNVLNWSNRDSEVLPDAIIQEAMSFAADNSYHLLVAPPFESRITYAAARELPEGGTHTSGTTTLGPTVREKPYNGLDYVELAVPNDLIDIVHIRSLGAQGLVFNERQDVRTFFDPTSDDYTSTYWSRQGSNFLVAGRNLDGLEFELYYHKRLPALDAEFLTNAANYNAGRVTPAAVEATTGTTLFFILGTTEDQIRASLVTAFDSAALAAAADDDTTVDNTITYVFASSEGNEVPNWLRDENRKILLYGALGYCGKFLQDQDMIAQNDQQWRAEIESVNREEKRRGASGGNVQVQYSSQLI